MVIKQAIIAAGGLNKRLTESKPKCLVEVSGHPILKYILDGILEIGVKKVVVATSETWQKEIKEYISTNYPAVGVQFSCSASNGLGYSLYHTRDLVDFNEPTLITVSDVICFDGYALFDRALDDSDLVLSTSIEPISSNKKYTLASVDSSGKLHLREEKNEHENSNRLIGIYALKDIEKFFDYLGSSIESVNNQQLLREQAINRNIINYAGEFRLSFVFEFLNLNNYKTVLLDLYNCREINTDDDLMIYQQRARIDPNISRLQQAIDVVEALSLEEQQLLLVILAKRLQRKQRQQLVEEVQEIRQEVAAGGIKYGSVKDFLAELDD